ncbi:hypothetical protein [Escherichia phage vB_EcoM_JNE01]|nr:hypothetical protein [Escherichia phage vB_EcoM_JNE01]
MKFNILRVSKRAIYAYEFNYDQFDVDIILYKNSQGEMLFKYQNSEADNIPLPDLTKMQEDEFFQQSLVYDIDFYSIDILLALQKKMHEIFNDLVQGDDSTRFVFYV